eukprot:179209-Rhodomonas_salina.1
MASPSRGTLPGSPGTPAAFPPRASSLAPAPRPLGPALANPPAATIAPPPYCRSCSRHPR